MFIFRLNGVMSGYSETRQFEGQEELAADHPDVVAYFLAARKRERLLEVSAELMKRNAAGFTYSGKTYQLDEASQGRIAALAAKADRFIEGKANATWDGRFIAADNTVGEFTAAQFCALADAASNVVISRRLYARDLKNLILQAADAAALAAIDVTAGWP